MTSPDLAAVTDLMRHQRACREFSADPVDDATITALLECATRAPSASNSQPWQFVVIRDPGRRGAIWDLATRAWAHGGRQHSEGRLEPELFRNVDTAMTGGFAEAPVTIVACADLDRCAENLVGSSLFPAVQNLLLAASAAGLGSALTTIAIAFAHELATLVGLPETVRPVAVLPVGWPAQPLGPSRREPIAEHAHREAYGTPWSSG